MLREILDFGWASRLGSGAAHAFFFAFFAAITLLGLLLDREFVYRGAPDRARWRDLRWWVVGIMAIQAALYAIF
ncbi:MAG TPA: hypothetical protein VHF22_00025 [Planctomycetota bacterium]|nr:hypothetical protein [Planctomycetota bacterium]